MSLQRLQVWGRPDEESELCFEDAKRLDPWHHTSSLDSDATADFETVARAAFDVLTEEDGIDAIQFASDRGFPLELVQSVLEDFAQRGWVAHEK
jgi:broad specificity phosphatase PhoE